MKTFKDVLATLPPVDKIARLEMFTESSYEPYATIENAPGKQGSLAVYQYLAVKHGGFNPKAAEEALEMFCEHTESAKNNPGAHPNIDRLFEIIEKQLYLSVKTVPAK